MKRIIIPVLILLVLAFSVSAQDYEKNRGLCIGFGMGWADVSYGPELDDALSSLESNPDITNVTVHVDALIGLALGQRLYAVGTVAGVGDRFEDSYGNYSQINTYLIGGGVRLYPFKTGLVLGVDYGIAKSMIDSSYTYETIESEDGTAYAVQVGYDFDRTMTGPALQVNARMGVHEIEMETITTTSIFASIVWK